MMNRRIAALSLSLVCWLGAGAKNKNKVLLSADVLQAQTVLVVVDPQAGTPLDAPFGNRTAQEDVEKALRNWGRFRLAINASDADLVIAVRKGSGKMAQPTVGGIPTNNRPVIFQPSESGPRIGGSNGSPSMPSDPTGAQPQTPHPQVEVGESQDMFVVYRGQRDNPLDYPPVWRYTAKDALRSPSVPAVDEFRKAIVEAEKQQANHP